MKLESRVVLFVAATHPLLRQLVLEAKSDTRWTIVPVELNATWPDGLRVGLLDGFPTFQVSPTEAVRMSIRLADTEGRYLMPSNAAIVAGMDITMAKGLIVPDPESRYAILLPSANEPFDYFAYEDELIDLGLGRLIRTP